MRRRRIFYGLDGTEHRSLRGLRGCSGLLDRVRSLRGLRSYSVIGRSVNNGVRIPFWRSVASGCSSRAVSAIDS